MCRAVGGGGGRPLGGGITSPLGGSGGMHS